MSQHFGDKLARVEWREVADLFACADEACWNFQFILNRDDDSVFAAAVEFGHDFAVTLLADGPMIADFFYPDSAGDKTVEGRSDHRAN